MRKLYLSMLMAVGLLVSGNAWAAVRTVGTTGSDATYSTIASAISAASAGDEIKLLTDMTENFTIDKNLTFSGDKTINGEMKPTKSITITLNGISIINSSEPIFNQASTDLVINISENSINNLSASASTAAGIAKIYGSLTISGEGTLNVSGNGYGIQVYGTLTIDAPNIKVTGPANNAIYTYGQPYTIKAGTYSNEVTVPVGYACASNGDGTYTVYAGSFLANGQAYQTIAEAVAAVNAGDEIKMVANLAGDCSINKSVIINLNDYNISGTITADGAEVTLRTREYDMNATAASTIGDISEINEGQIVFREGTYNLNPEGHLAPDMYSKSYASNSETIYAVAPHIAQVGSNYYLCLREALNAIPTNGEGTIKLLNDAVLDAVDCSISDKTIIIDFNGHNIEGGNNGYYILLNTNSSLTLTGTGTYSVNKYGIQVKGAPAPHTTQTILNIGKDIVISAGSESIVVVPYEQPKGNYAKDENGNVGTFGVKVFVEGTLAAMSSSLNVLGTSTSSDDCPEITIAPTAVLNKIYAAGFAKWIMNGGRMSNVFEIRAGELTINDGEISVSADRAITCNPNGSGSTSTGAAVAVAQHNTKQPIVVTINGGTFTAPIAMLQVNPQNNTELDYKKMIVNVTGGKFTSTHTTGGTLYENVPAYGGTVTYADDAMCISQNKRIFLMGGFYNYDPVEFVAMGYKRYPITESDYPIEYAAGYRYRIGEIDQAGEQEKTVNSGDWKTQATTVWEKDGGTGTEPTDETPVVIENDKQVIVTTPATAYSVTVGNGTSKLTVKKTGRLMVGAGGVNGTTDQSFIVEDGGQMAISPATNDYQPEATVELTVNWARRKAAADGKAQGDLVASDLYWQHIATPLSDGAAPTLSQTGVSYVNTWNLINGWTGVTKDAIVSPFVGYQVSSINKSTDEKITYTFKGQLVGNHVDPMKFTRIGFSFFGNSYLAPIDIRELLTCLETKGAIDPTVLLYDSENGVYESINRASYYIPGTKAEIQPLQGFFVFAESATNVDFDYRKAVWDAFCAKAATPAMAPATAPAMQENPFSAIACIDVQAESGAKDRVMLFEGDELSAAEDKGYDAHKMMTSGMNIYAKGSYADLAILATNNLLGSELVLKTDANTNYTLSFANIKGEYALYDALTGRTINMVEGATYDFEAQSNATITDRFFVVEAAKAPTTMENVDAQAGSCKFMKNGIMFIERNNKVYNAQGQIVK